MFSTGRRSGKPKICNQIGPSQGGTQVGPMLIGYGGDAQPAIGALVEPVQGVKAERHPVQPGPIGDGAPIRGHPRHRAIEQVGVDDGGVDHLAFAGSVPMVEGLDDRSGPEEPIARVADGDRRPVGCSPVIHAAFDPRDAGYGRRGLVVADEVLARAVLVAARMAIDDGRVDVAQ